MDHEVLDLNIGMAQKLYQRYVDLFDDEQGGFDGKSTRKFINLSIL